MKCRQCNGCLKATAQDRLYYVCYLCKTIYLVVNFEVTEITDKDKKNEILGKLNLGVIE
jgi:hypothetical protein